MNEKEFRATTLSFYIILITRGLHYISSIVLIALLLPEDFGVMAVVMSIFAFMNAISTFGIDSALISYQGNERDLADDAWTIEIFKGLFLASCLFLLSPVISTWLNQPVLYNLLGVMSLVFLIQSIKNIGLISLRKRLEFGPIFRCELGMALVSFVVTIFWALYEPSPWAIAGGYISGWIAYVILSYILCSYRPKLSFNINNLRVIFNYSKWVLASTQINASIENGINLFIGSQFGMSVLGQFERADMFTRKTALQAGEVLWKVGLPSFANKSATPILLKNNYIFMFRLICFFLLPLMCLIVYYLPIFIEINSNQEWDKFQGLLNVMGCLGIVTILLTPGSIMFQAIRRPEIGFRASYIRLATILVVIIPLMRLYGVNGIAYSLMAGVLSVVPYTFWNIRSLIDVSFREHISIFLVYFLPCVVFILLGALSDGLLPGLVGVIFLCLLYLGIVLIISQQTRTLLSDIVKRVLA